MRNKSLFFKILIWAEVVIAARILLFELPLMLSDYLMAGIFISSIENIFHVVIVLTALLYLLAGFATIAGRRGWRSYHYTCIISVCLLNIGLLEWYGDPQFHDNPHYFLPAIASFIICLLVLVADRQRRKSVLIIDDDPAFLKMVSTTLEKEGYDVISSLTGEEGLRLAREICPDLVLLDVILPGIKGRDVCAQLKENKMTQDIPVIFLTAKNAPEDVEQELKVGAVGHITKPMDSKTILSEVKSLLKF